MSTTLPFETTLEVRDTCLCLHTQRAARALSRRFDEVFRPFGLTSGQFSLLISLNRPQPPTMAPVAKLLAMDRTTLIAALKPLELQGLVSVAVNQQDRRSRLLILTDQGREMLIALVPIWRATLADVQAELSTVTPVQLVVAMGELVPSK